jgi:nucleotide-binding universal stress UspA family protein
MKDILVHVDCTDGGKARLEYAFDMATCFGARVTGVHVRAPIDVPPYYKPHAVEQVAANLERSADRDAIESERLFRQIAAERTVESCWRALEGHMAQRLCEQSRCADLVVLGQYEAEGAPQRRPLYLAEEVVLGAGRPVLVVPEAQRQGFRCRRVSIGWDASREAARAVHDALALLNATKPRIEIVALEEAGKAVAVAELADHLTRHGLTVDISPQTCAPGSQGAALVRQLDAGEFDLMVIGAYGHPVWLQLLFGGSTMSVLAHAPVPVLISH